MRSVAPPYALCYFASAFGEGDFVTARPSTTLHHKKLMQINLTPDWSVVAIIAIFLANYFVVRRFFIKPVTEVLDWRQSEIASAERLYEESLQRFNAATSEVETRIHAAKREGAQEREARRGEALAYRDQLVTRVRGEAETLSQSARQQLESDTVTARAQIVRDSENLAHLAAEKILGRKI
jgi:F-type H+-transporting ATPase subunit b